MKNHTLNDPIVEYSSYKHYGKQEVEIWKDKKGEYRAVAMNSTTDPELEWKFVGHTTMYVEEPFFVPLYF